MPPDVVVIQHVPWEGPGRIAGLAERAGLRLVPVLGTAAEALPDVADVARLGGLVLMGGPMGALDDDAHPVLLEERALVRAALAAGVPVLGVCLGHQLVATTLGAALHDGTAAEIGFGRVSAVGASPEFGADGAESPVLHWHGDEVELPEGAALLASSRGCRVQAFRTGSALGVQFHAEVDAAGLEQWLDEPSVRAELEGVADPVDLLAAVRAAEAPVAALAERLFRPFLAAAARRGRTPPVSPTGRG